MFFYPDNSEILETWISISSFKYFRVVRIEKQIRPFVFWEKLRLDNIVVRSTDLYHNTKFETDLFSNQHQVIYYQLCIEYRESPDNTVFISMVPSLTVFFLKEIEQIPLSNTIFIRNKHFLPHETQIKQPIFTAYDT